jgi:protein-tyrosine-phosphatase
VFSFPVTIELPILFFCVENTRSQMVEGFFDKYAPKGYGITLML